MSIFVIFDKDGNKQGASFDKADAARIHDSVVSMATLKRFGIEPDRWNATKRQVAEEFTIKEMEVREKKVVKPEKFVKGAKTGLPQVPPATPLVYVPLSKEEEIAAALPKKADPLA